MFKIRFSNAFIQAAKKGGITAMMLRLSTIFCKIPHIVAIDLYLLIHTNHNLTTTNCHTQSILSPRPCTTYINTTTVRFKKLKGTPTPTKIDWGSRDRGIRRDHGLPFTGSRKYWTRISWDHGISGKFPCFYNY